MNVRSHLAKAALALIVAVPAAGMLASPAGAAASFKAGNCNTNYDANPDVYSLVVRAPAIYSNNGGTQSVRYRSLLEKWDGSKWAKIETGAWHSGSATPTRAYVDSARTWALNGRGGGSFTTLVQTQYYASGAWGSTQSRFTPYYNDNEFYSGSWHYVGDVDWCDVY